jgi:hypothetical protein
MLRAWIYLTGVLPLFEDLVLYDEQSRTAIAGRSLVVQFEVRHGPMAHLAIDAGTIRYGSGSHPRPDVRLTFKTPDRLNRMFGGERARPGLRKGFRYLRFLMGGFPTLAGRLSYYLEGEGTHGIEADDEARRFLVGLRLRALLGGAAAVAGNDDWLSDVAEHTPVGKLHMTVLPDGPRGTLEKAVHDGTHEFAASYGAVADHPNAVLEFTNLNAAWRVVSGETGFGEAASLGDVHLAGNIVLAEQMNIFMHRLVTVMGF